MKTLCIDTAAGTFRASFSGNGLAQLEFPRAGPLHDRPPRETLEDREPLGAWKRLTRSAIESLVDGRSPDALPPFDLSKGTEFQRSVWHALTAIPFGQTQSYAEIARAIGRPKATRAVGQACGANPIPLLIPCHRVLAANRQIGGFSGGLDWKRRLLAREGVQIE